MCIFRILCWIVFCTQVLLCVGAHDVLTYLPKCNNLEGLDTSHVEIPSNLMSNNKTTKFWLSEQHLTCSFVLDNISISITSEPEYDSNSNANETDYEDAEVDMEGTKFEPNGILKYERGHYWRNEYCLQSINETEIVINICNISCTESGGKICVPKCCEWGKLLEFGNHSKVSCVEVEDSTVNWRPDVYHPHNTTACLESMDKTEDCLHLGIPEEVFHYQNLFTGCDDVEYMLDNIAFDDTPFAFSKDGILRVAEYNLSFSQYCIDGLANGIESNEGRSHAALACICSNEDPYVDERKTIDVLYVVVMFISASFLLLTVIVYILIWDKQNIHGWTVFSLSISMGLMLIFLGTARLVALYQGRENTTGSGPCVFVGILAHFFLLTTFALLTCLSFDLWWTFRSLAPSIGKSKGILRFRMYLGFSIGLAFIIVSIGFILDQVYGHIPKNDRKSWLIILPEYGIDTCYIANKYAQGVYIFLPAAILLLANLLFFLTTMWIMYQYHKNTQTARKNSVNQKQTLYLFTKLFFVMGVTWTVEVIEYLTGYNRQERDNRNCIIFYEPGRAWIVTDLFNILQGMAIFCIFVCKKTVMLHLSRRSSTLRVLISPVFLLPCCKLNQLDLESPSGKTNQSSVSMRTFTPRSPEMSEM